MVPSSRHDTTRYNVIIWRRGVDVKGVVEFLCSLQRRGQSNVKMVFVSRRVHTADAMFASGDADGT
jgi:hypothetical protein